MSYFNPTQGQRSRLTVFPKPDDSKIKSPCFPNSYYVPIKQGKNEMLIRHLRSFSSLYLFLNTAALAHARLRPRPERGIEITAYHSLSLSLSLSLCSGRSERQKWHLDHLFDQWYFGFTKAAAARRKRRRIMAASAKWVFSMQHF